MRSDRHLCEIGSQACGTEEEAEAQGGGMTYSSFCGRYGKHITYCPAWEVFTLDTC